MEAARVHHAARRRGDVADRGAGGAGGMPVIGYVRSASLADAAHLVSAFRLGLKEAGFIEGQNVTIEYRSGENDRDRLTAIVTDFTHRPVSLIIANVVAALAAKAATTTVPIVSATGSDPVKDGLVPSLNRPGGNVTGVSVLDVELGAKRLELLHELVPTATIIALLINPTSPNAETQSREMQAAARIFGLQLDIVHASAERDFDTVFATLVQLRAGGLVISPDPFFNSRDEQIVALALRHVMPTISQFRRFAAAGGLMSYGSSQTDQYRLAGVYTGRILKGEKPANLPVQQSTKIELIINMKTAKALGLTIPETLLATADEVIQ
jgi:putative ABC transport system substrate-binding protein